MKTSKFEELGEQWIELREVPLGGFFRLSESASSPVWVRESYERASKKYIVYKYDDVNYWSEMKGSRKVFVGFIF